MAWAALVGAVTACAYSRPLQPWEHDPRALADTLPIYEPEGTVSSEIYEQLLSTGMPTGEGVRTTRGGPALSVDPNDDVVNSTWFTHRNGVRRLSTGEIERGPRTGTGPDQSGPITVVSLKAEGVAPGFTIRDASGHEWIVKFDPPEFPEMATGAEVVATNLIWAAGYNTPENHIFHLDPEALRLAGDLEVEFVESDSVASYKVGGAGDHDFTVAVFRRNILDRYPRRPDGTIRALASKFLEGIPKGPFRFSSRRKDDPNDVIRHEHRRELRGLYPVAAWLNHVDARRGSTLDMFVVDPRSPRGEGVRHIGYVRHYLVDFGSALGSGSTYPHDPRNGTEASFDAGAIGRRLFTLGAYRRPWQTLGPVTFPPSIGYYSVDNFDPGDWRTTMWNPAFRHRTPGDGYWGAKLVMSFTDDQLEAAVRAGQYSDPEARAYLLQGLKDRRDATGRYWFSQVTPLDRPRVEGAELVFDDLWVRHFGGASEYRYDLLWDAPDPDLELSGFVPDPRIPLPDPVHEPPGGDEGEDRYVRIQVWRRAPDGKWTPRPATFWLDWDPATRTYHMIGSRY